MIAHTQLAVADCERGYRADYWPGYYAAFVHDLDGHNVEAASSP